MATLKGKYAFKETLDVESLRAMGEFVEYFNFISGYEGNPAQHYELQHTGMYMEIDTLFGDIYFGYTLPDDNRKLLVYLNGWEVERLRYVDFGDGATMSDRLSSWILANADYVFESEYVIEAEMLTEIADAIRAKTGKTDTMLTENMATEINNIEVGIIPSGVLEITANGVYDVTNKASVTVAVEAEDAEFNIAYGDTAPTDTTKLWIKGEKGETMAKTRIKYTLNATSVAQFPIHLYEGAFTSLGEYIYIFGGMNKTNSNYVSNIYRYNIATKETVILSPNGTTFPSISGAVASSVVDGKIYIFGGRTSASYSDYLDTIYCYTIATNTLEKLSTTMPKAMESMTSQAVGTDIYIFGGNNQGTRNNVIYKFDTTNNTIVATNAVLYTPAFGLSSAKLPNDGILIFGGYDNFKDVFRVSKYVATTDTCYVTYNCIAAANGRAVANGYMVFLSYTSGSAYIYDARTSTFTKYTVGQGARLGHIALYNNKVYVASSYNQQDVVEFEVTFALENSKYCIELGNAGYEVNLYGNTYANVLRVFVGDADGKAQIAEAYAYDTTKQKWVNVATDEEI